jgi:hypothetical protein
MLVALLVFTMDSKMEQCLYSPEVKCSPQPERGADSNSKEAETVRAAESAQGVDVPAADRCEAVHKPQVGWRLSGLPCFEEWAGEGARVDRRSWNRCSTANGFALSGFGHWIMATVA